MGLSGKVAAIIGASSVGGIGAAIGSRLVEAGADVTVAGRNSGGAEDVAAAIGGHAAKCDVRDEDSLARFFDDLQRDRGRVDVAVNAAGVSHFGMLNDFDPDSAREVVETQFIGALLFIKHGARAMRGAGGALVLLSSLTATTPAPGQAVYAGTKAGVDHAIKVAALEYGPQGIRVNAVAPGLVRTPMTERMFANPGFEACFARETALGRIATVEDVAGAVAWLAGDECFLTGEVIPVSGGASLRRLPTAEELMEAGRKS